MNLKFKFKQTILKYAPGIISGAADNDPSGIATYSIAGARFGYAQNFLMILASPMLIATAAMAGRLGEVRGKGLVAILIEFLPRRVVYLLVVLLSSANVFTLGADISGMAAAASLVLVLPAAVWAVVFTAIAWYFVLFRSFRDLQKYFLWLVLFFLSYVVAAFLARPSWLDVFRQTLWPPINFTAAFWLSALATLGTTITPFLFFWQAKEEVEFHRLDTPHFHRLANHLRQSLKFARAEERSIAPGLIFSQVIGIFIMTVSGTVLYRHGVGDITTAAQAAAALEPLAGSFAKYLFALGLVGSGLLAIPVLSATTAYAVAELFGWRDSLWDKVGRARRFYGLITLTIFSGLLVAVLPFDPIQLLFYSQVVNGVITPFLIGALLYLTNNQKVMGKLRNGFFDNFFAGLAILVMLGSLVYLVAKSLLGLG